MSHAFKFLFLTGILSVAFVAGAAAPTGWMLAGSQPDNYDTGVDRAAVYDNRPSAYLKAKSVQDGYGTLMQTISAAHYAGKRVRLGGFVKTDAVTRSAGLWMRIDGRDPERPLAFDNMDDRPISGTTGWQHYEVVLDVAPDATAVAFGILLNGPGEAWLNAVSLEVVDLSVPVTGYGGRLPRRPRNLTFEE